MSRVWTVNWKVRVASHAESRIPPAALSTSCSSFSLRSLIATSSAKVRATDAESIPSASGAPADPAREPLGRGSSAPRGCLACYAGCAQAEISHLEAHGVPLSDGSCIEPSFEGPHQQLTWESKATGEPVRLLLLIRGHLWQVRADTAHDEPDGDMRFAPEANPTAWGGS